MARSGSHLAALTFRPRVQHILFRHSSSSQTKQSSFAIPVVIRKSRRPEARNSSWRFRRTPSPVLKILDLVCSRQQRRPSEPADIRRAACTRRKQGICCMSRWGWGPPQNADKADDSYRAMSGGGSMKFAPNSHCAGRRKFVASGFVARKPAAAVRGPTS